jgi:hypothetical protein
MENKFEAKVVKILNDYEVVINKGHDDGVKENQRFLLYYFDEELFDPDTFESLGKLEIICGKAKVKHVQDKQTTLISDQYENKDKRTITKKKSDIIFSYYNQPSEEEIIEPSKELKRFENVNDKCIARRI